MVAQTRVRRCRIQAGPLGLVLTVVLVLSGTPRAAVAQDVPFGSAAFEQRWSAIDRPVALGLTARTWFWGPEPITPPLEERYRESPGDTRLVQYFDKGRMELTDPAGDPSDPWYVTGGLLTRELVSGRIQIGDETFLDTGSGATIPVAGDADNPFPTYADLRAVVDASQPDRRGQFATAVLTPEGGATYAEAADDPNAEFVAYVEYVGPYGQTVGYNVPRAFWAFMTQGGLVWQDGEAREAEPLFDWLSVLGYPIADPFWARVRLNGAPTWVLIQPFERRVLTYTPANPPGWRVEMGNIGQHYYAWRYRFTPPTKLGDGASYYGLKPLTRWVYGTSMGSDEVWETENPTERFVGGSTLVPRRESGPTGTRVTYWGITEHGVLLYGVDVLDETGAVVDTVLYWPPIRLLSAADLSEDATWSTETTRVSTRDSARHLVVAVQVHGAQLVGTTYGIVPAWKLVLTEIDLETGAATTTTLWFSPGLGIVQWIGNGYAAQLKSIAAAQQ